ncbi:Cysteine-rich secretory protein family protein [Lactobacillus bombicola]|uniref:Cysteine-rich secretory protein family protein n=1 Tax=Lactobacillus bombicola TaxID=1505723 RepID=A0A1I1RWF8_9LACO|nr:CAP domain-containing protein [Lactobacillus bombicola]SFD38392.1 Cysteine-rich secretory protein family protein [Lactobacillus bombicola]
MKTTKKALEFLAVNFIFLLTIGLVGFTPKVTAATKSDVKANVTKKENKYITDDQIKKIFDILKPSYSKYFADSKTNKQSNKGASSKSKKNKTPNKKPKQNNNAATFMDFLSTNNSLTAAQKAAAKTAATLLRTGKLGNKSAPVWFKTYVDLNSAKDATSISNIQATLKNLSNVNKVRAQLKEKQLRISPILTALSMIDADYQKHGTLTEPQYYEYTNNLENLASGTDPVKKWLSEQANWKANVTKTPSLAPYEFSPNWKNNKYGYAVYGANGYKESGHYLNLVNKNHCIMGMAHMIPNSKGYVDVFNAADTGTASSLKVSEYKKLITEWLHK